MTFLARHFLRGETREQHDRLHRHGRLAVLAGGALDEAAYRAALLALFRGFAPLEALLHRSPRAAGRPLVRRIPRLRRDLTGLGIGPGTLPDDTAWTGRALTDEADFLGHWYVHAGSALGGRAIGDSLARRNAPWPRSFFAAQPDLEQRQWRACCAALDAVVSEADLRRLGAAARRAFDDFAARLDPEPSRADLEVA